MPIITNHKMNIQNSTIDDIEKIFHLYETAINYQKEKGSVPWAGLTRSMVEKR